MFEELTGFRHEHKYVEPAINLISAEMRLGAVMGRDPHVSGRGYYGVRSLYFDDYRDRYFGDSLAGVDEREKWRIRIYDRRSDHIRLECKIRRSDLVSKLSCRIDAATFGKLTGKMAEMSSGNPPLLNRFIGEMRMHALAPAVIVEYERTPFVCANGNTRITIDRNIRSSCEIDALLADRDIASRPVMTAGRHLLEVKFDAFLPDHIAHAIEHGRMRRETFSKYYLARKFPFDGVFIKH